MEKVLYKIGKFFGSVFGLILVLIIGVFSVLALPVDYIKYKRSYYYKTERKKYSFFAATSMHFELYNLIAKNNLPIKYFKNPKNDSLNCGWFVFEDTLFIIDDCGFEYDAENGSWNHTAYIYDDDKNEEEIKEPLCEFLKNEIDQTNEIAGKTICTKAVVLLDGNIFDNAKLAKQQEGFLVYNDNLAEVLKAFCEKD